VVVASIGATGRGGGVTVVFVRGAGAGGRRAAKGRRGREKVAAVAVGSLI